MQNLVLVEAVPSTGAWWRDAHAVSNLCRVTIAAAAVVMGVGYGPAAYRSGVIVTDGLRALPVRALPMPRAIDPVQAQTDATPVRVTVTEQWRQRTIVSTVDAVLHDRSLWRRMYFGDWDRLPADLREPALRLMMRVYRPLLSGPRVWRGMTTAQWDAVPQPVRAIAYLRMVWYWTRHEHVGEKFGFTPGQLAPTIAAIVMTESWFEHRAVNRGASGNRDLGLAQCSDYCRGEIAAMAERGAIDFAPDESDYFDPLVGTRVAVVWFARELRRADGDVELAIRAYHRGIDDAYDARGDAYLAAVRQRRQRYVRNLGAPPSWRLLAADARDPAAAAR